MGEKSGGSIIKYSLSSLIAIFISFLSLDYLYPLDTARLSKPISYRIYDVNNKLLRLQLSEDGYWRFPAKTKEIPELLKESVLLFEDRWFYWHFGLNPVAVIKAFIHNSSNKGRIGASTISMQVARMMHRRERTLLSKLLELFSAFQLEWHYSKDEILTYYFNLAPYGGNIEGVKTAAWFYFNKSLHELSTSQIAILTTIPKNPNANRVDKQKNLSQKRQRVLKLLYEEALIDSSRYERALLEPIVSKRFSVPSLAFQYTQNSQLRQEGDIITGLNYEIHSFVKAILHKGVQKLQYKNVHNGAAVIIDNRSMEVVAYLGSDDFYHKQGQNDGVKMLRSPGSTLKPFIYAKAFDAGLITPKRELFDVPIHIGSYAPQNFNRRFVGLISAKEALQYSLNIPAIELNRLMKENSLYEILQDAGIASVDERKDYYGDSLALGGFGLSLLDLTHLYTAFANDGIRHPLHVSNTTLGKKRQLFSKEAAWITSEILSDAIRPELSAYWESVEGMVRVGFKTGTSADSKDLYTIAYSKEYTVGVWLGNFDGTKTDNLTGINTASKLVFEIFRELNTRETMHWMQKPQKVKQKQLCVDALELATCKKRDLDYLIDDVVLQRPCELLRAEVLSFMMDEKMIDSSKTLLKHRCYPKWSQYRPILVSPYDGAQYIFDTQGDKNATKIMLKCYTFKEEQSLYWVIDDTNMFEGKSAQESYISLEKGKHLIGCLDSASAFTQNSILLK
ncbi:MAG: penicillin-binding protein 1C, partial [Campylobacterota bacterium]|nr:penicillin-binding protein 1C [Campylobacterota bacterium]